MNSELIEPIDFDGALEAAETICHLKIAEILELRDGVNAFVCLNPGRPDCAVFDIGGVKSGEVMAFPAEVFHFRGQLELYSRNRKQIQVWMMRLVRAFPNSGWQGARDDLPTETAVHCLRIAPEDNAISPISTTQITAGTNEKSITVFTATIQFDIVFGTGARSAAEA